MNGLRAAGTLCAALVAAFLLDVAVCLLPENDYQRWQLLDGTIYEHLRWMYERIHFDPRPIDVVIVGPSGTLLGLSPSRIEERLASLGRPGNVANFSLEAAGRNLNWAIIEELYKFKSKSPKVIVVGIGAEPHPYGHPAFKYVAPAEAIVFPPEPLLHNYFYDLAYLPARKTKLFGARLLGFDENFQPQTYAQTRTDFSTSFVAEGRTVDMDREVPRATLLSQKPDPVKPTFLARALARCCNEGDDHVYIREIAQLAEAHGARLVFDFLPFFNGPLEISDRAFLEQYGAILYNNDLSQQSGLYENWSHLNHNGAMIASDRLAQAIADQNLGLSTSR